MKDKLQKACVGKNDMIKEYLSQGLSQLNYVILSPIVEAHECFTHESTHQQISHTLRQNIMPLYLGYFILIMFVN